MYTASCTRSIMVLPFGRSTAVIAVTIGSFNFLATFGSKPNTLALRVGCRATSCHPAPMTQVSAPESTIASRYVLFCVKFSTDTSTYTSRTIVTPIWCSVVLSSLSCSNASCSCCARKASTEASTASGLPSG